MAFTIVFDGDISDFPCNPYLTDTPFGRPVAVAAYDALGKLQDLEEELESNENVAEQPT